MSEDMDAMTVRELAEAAQAHERAAREAARRGDDDEVDRRADLADSCCIAAIERTPASLEDALIQCSLIAWATCSGGATRIERAIERRFHPGARLENLRRLVPQA